MASINKKIVMIIHKQIKNERRYRDSNSKLCACKAHTLPVELYPPGPQENYIDENLRRQKELTFLIFFLLISAFRQRVFQSCMLFCAIACPEIRTTGYASFVSVINRLSCLPYSLISCSLMCLEFPSNTDSISYTQPSTYRYALNFP